MLTLALVQAMLFELATPACSLKLAVSFGTAFCTAYLLRRRGLWTWREHPAALSALLPLRHRAYRGQTGIEGLVSSVGLREWVDGVDQ